MSRMEKHKARREGLANSSNDTKEDLDFNPINKVQDEIELPKRTRVMDSPKIEKVILEEPAPLEVKHDDVFDIDTAFKRLQTNKKRDVAYDTQLAIINDIFSDNMIEYNSTQKLYLDSITDKIMISEDELLKILDDRESHIRQQKTNPKNDIKPMKKVSNIFGEKKSNYKNIKEVKPEEIVLNKEEIIDLNNISVMKEAPVTEEIVVEELINSVEPIKQELAVSEEEHTSQEVLEEKVHLFIDDDDQKYDFSNMENKKGNIIAVIIVIILLAVLGFLVYKYIL